MFILVVSAVLAAAPVFAQPSPQRVVVTYSSRSIASIDLFVAQERGFFREEGLDPQLVQVRATAAIAAIVSGEVHALGSIGSAIRGHSARRADQSSCGGPAPPDLSGS
jgi:ABC-type nitrate/sulfonate/bicarbonate transport system substrate-binding protein